MWNYNSAKTRPEHPKSSTAHCDITAPWLPRDVTVTPKGVLAGERRLRSSEEAGHRMKKAAPKRSNKDKEEDPASLAESDEFSVGKPCGGGLQAAGLHLPGWRSGRSCHHDRWVLPVPQVKVHSTLLSYWVVVPQE